MIHGRSTFRDEIQPIFPYISGERPYAIKHDRCIQSLSSADTPQETHPLEPCVYLSEHTFDNPTQVMLRVLEANSQYPPRI